MNKWALSGSVRPFLSLLFGEKQNELVVVESANKIRALNCENISGPCQDRTDDPQIKSVSDEDESMPE